jgi:hypothetical protein
MVEDHPLVGFFSQSVALPFREISGGEGVKAHLRHFADWKLLGGSHFSLAPTVARALQFRLKQRKNSYFPHFFRDVEGSVVFSSSLIAAPKLLLSENVPKAQLSLASQTLADRLIEQSMPWSAIKVRNCSVVY